MKYMIKKDAIVGQDFSRYKWGDDQTAFSILKETKVWNASILNTPCKICMAKNDAINEVIEMLLPKPAPPDTGDDE